MYKVYGTLIFVPGLDLDTSGLEPNTQWRTVGQRIGGGGGAPSGKVTNARERSDRAGVSPLPG